jgi:hypothetical protein
MEINNKYDHIQELDELEQAMLDAGLDFLFIDVSDDGDGVLVLTDHGRKVKEFFVEREARVCDVEKKELIEKIEEWAYLHYSRSAIAEYVHVDLEYLLKFLSKLKK